VRDEEPNWQPVSALPMMTARAAEGVRLAREHLELLRRAHPYQLDDATASRVIATWQDTRDDLDHHWPGTPRPRKRQPRRRSDVR
jgi:hypothetical protein